MFVIKTKAQTQLQLPTVIGTLLKLVLSGGITEPYKRFNMICIWYTLLMLKSSDLYSSALSGIPLCQVAVHSTTWLVLIMSTPIVLGLWTS